jgi:hypothetical protein
MVAGRLRKLSCLCLVLGTLPLVACSKSGDDGAAGVPLALEAKAGAPASPAPPAAGEAHASLRRVVKKASLELVAESPARVQAEAGRIAERLGGFVVSSTQTAVASEDTPAESVELTLRVPSAAFGRALDQLRALGRGNGSEQVSSEDVSEEFVDLDARIRNQERLEQQFQELLKRADKVEQALLVHREITAVRTEIDRMRGRKNFLERETALSTIRLVIAPERPLVTASFRGFERATVAAYSDAVNVGAGLVTGAIRAAGLLVPLGVLFGIPLAIALLLRRRKAKLLAATPG